MPNNSNLKDNSAAVAAKLKQNMETALTAVGMKAQELTVEQMQNGYSKAIWLTGTLQRDVLSPDNRVVDVEKGTVTIGTVIEYAGYVHDGTRKMKERPFYRDALLNDSAAETLQTVFAAYLKKGFNT